MKLSTTAFGDGIQISFRLNELSPIAQVQLFRELGQLLEIWDRFLKEPEETNRAQEIITEQWEKYSENSID